jgi:hypothetical protein
MKLLLEYNFQKELIKDQYKMEQEMAMEHFIINKVVDIQDIGITIKWMDMVHYIILMDELLIKGNGKMTHFMEKVF